MSVTLLADYLVRIENLSHILCWTDETTCDQRGVCSVSLLELPRLRLSFTCSVDTLSASKPSKPTKLTQNSSSSSSSSAKPNNPNAPILFECDQRKGLFLSNYRDVHTNKLLKGLSSCVLLESLQQELYILLPSSRPLITNIISKPLSTTITYLRCDQAWSVCI